MEVQATLKTYGKADIPEGTEDRPLVTFALFAYNQEEFIREAVEGALSQTYQPLEIIISDDGSTDRTYDIICDIVKDYTGPSRLVLRRNRQNIGLIAHINSVLSEAAGDFIVLAAGDDISRPERVRFVLDVFLACEDAFLVHSSVNEINKEGHFFGIKRPPDVGVRAEALEVATSLSVYIGASGAIKREVFSSFGPILMKGTYEDLVFGFRAVLLGKVKYIDAPLVSYRSQIGMSSFERRSLKSINDLRESNLSHKIETLKQRFWDLRHNRKGFDGGLRIVLLKELLIARRRRRIQRAYFVPLRIFAARLPGCSAIALWQELYFTIRFTATFCLRAIKSR